MQNIFYMISPFIKSQIIDLLTAGTNKKLTVKFEDIFSSKKLLKIQDTFFIIFVCILTIFSHRYNLNFFYPNSH